MKSNIKLKNYEIYLETNFDKVEDLFNQLGFTKHKIMVVFDSNTAVHYKESFLTYLGTFLSEVYSFEFQAGEVSKNLATVNLFYQTLIQHKFDRKDIILAFGGGVVGDLAGFSAATYLRGIRFIQFPTTLLAMSDSSIGGKTGVDFMSYKNMVGAFHHPSLVYMNLGLLHTLPEREYLSGMAEIIKAAYIKDRGLIELIRVSHELILKKEFSGLLPILYKACEIKKKVVEEDFQEKGERALLNFGHTIGHAIEKLVNFQLLHGECVSLGMIAAAQISVLKGYISKETVERMKKILHSYHLPTSLKLNNYAFSIQDVINATKLDKKMEGGRIKFVLLEEEGRAIINTTVTNEDLLAGISEIIE